MIYRYRYIVDIDCMETTRFLFFVSILIVIIYVFFYRDREDFVSNCQVRNGFPKENYKELDYYDLDWNDPMMMTKINMHNIRDCCRNCRYSMSCDYTDDALPFCHKSCDVPSIVNNKLMIHSY